MRQKVLKLLLVGVVAVGGGCVHYNHVGYDTAIRCAADHPIKPALRSQVHLFVLNGIDPTEDEVMFRMRDEVVRAGFPMVHLAQRSDDEFYYREMHRLTRDQPPARFVILGYGLAAGQAQELACRVSGEGLPIDSLILLDPAGGSTEYLLDEQVPITIVRSHHWPSGRNVRSTDVTEVASVGHLSLPANGQTVAVLSRILADSAMRVRLEPPDSLPHLTLSDRPQPPPRPNLPVVLTSVSKETEK